MVFMAITLILNLFVLARGVAKGIELLAKVAIPLLFLFCVLMAVRVFTLSGEGTALEGLSFLWAPDFSRLGEFGVWMAAAGQVFFTLSIGFGSLESYASYVRADDDIALTGLTTAATNEFAEVIFGSVIAIPAAAVFFGAGAIETGGRGRHLRHRNDLDAGNLALLPLRALLRDHLVPAAFLRCLHFFGLAGLPTGVCASSKMS